MFNKKKEDMKRLLELYQARYDSYLANGIQFDASECSGDCFLLPGKFGDILMVDFGKKIHADSGEIINNYLYEGEIELAGERIYLSFTETDFINKNDVVHNGFIKDNNGLRILPFNLSNKEFDAVCKLKLDVFEQLQLKNDEEKQMSI